MLNMRFDGNWKRPFTAKRYLHPPLAEYMYTIWADMKVMCGEIEEKKCGYRSAAFKLLTGRELHSPDFEKVQTIPREDGLPLHALRYDTEDYRLDMEACCNTGTRVPSVFVKITVTNVTHRTQNDQLAILPRTGREDHLTGMEVDGYAHYDSSEHNYGFIPSEWEYNAEKKCLFDSEYEIALGTCEFDPIWQEEGDELTWYQRRILLLPFTLQAHEARTLTLLMRPRMEAPLTFCYEDERGKCAAFWQKELGRIRRVPDSEVHMDVVRNLTVQCLQMFAYPRGKNYVLARQGGLQRVVWPSEAVEFLLPLDAMGDFGDYTELVYDAYFDVMIDESGELHTTTGWASHTAAAMWSCSNYLICSRSQHAYEKYKDKLYRSFSYIERRRRSTYEMDCIGKGIFPPMRSTDWPGEYQSWCMTDCTNLDAIRALADAFELFGDPRAAEIRNAFHEYMACMKKLLAAEVAKNTCKDEILLTNKIGRELSDPPSGPYFIDGPAALLRVGVIDANSATAHQVETYFRHRGCFHNGLTGLMNDGLIFQGHNADPWAGHTWYLSSTDLAWFETWLRQGETEKARETMEAQLYYGMSPAYNLLERYADNDPYWVPWMPNASANGRLLQMLFRFYGSKELA